MSGYPPPGGYAPPPYGDPNTQPAGYGYQQPTAPGFAPAPVPGYPAPGAYPTGPQTWPAGAAAPAPGADRPPREQCFFIKSKSSNQILEVQGAGVDPGTKVVTSAVKGQGQDSQFWFEDLATGTIKSRLNLLCLDLQGSSPGFQLIRNTGSPPHGTISLGRQTDGGGQHQSAVAHTQWGTIPGKAKGKTCWYSYAGKEHITNDFSWVVATGVSSVKNAGSPPPGAMAVGHQTDGSGVYYAAIARTRWGTIPGKAQGNICHFPYADREEATSDFDWLVAEQSCLIVNTFMPGNPNQLWVRSGNRIQSRQDPNKVLQVNGNRQGSSVSAWSNTGAPQQLWDFPNPSPAAGQPGAPFGVPPAGAVHVPQPHVHHQPTRYFYLRSELHGKVLDVHGGSKQAGAMAILWPRKPQSDNQLWYLDAEGIIRSKLTNFALQPSGHGIWLQPYKNLPNQKWMLSGKQIHNNNSGNCIEVSGANQADGTKTNQSKYKGKAGQHWVADYI